MTLLSENQINFIATYLFTAHTYRQIQEPEDYPEPVKPIIEIAHQLRTNNTDSKALYNVLSDWTNGLADPMLLIIENLLDLMSQR